MSLATFERILHHNQVAIPGMQSQFTTKMPIATIYQSLKIKEENHVLFSMDMKNI